MAKQRRSVKSSKKTTRRGGIFSRVYSPIEHLIQATRNVGSSAFTRSGKIVDEGLGFVQDTGKAIASHTNMAVRDITRRKNRKASATRKNRKASRKNRKASRKNRK